MKHLKKVTKPSKAAGWNWPGELLDQKQDWIDAFPNLVQGKWLPDTDD